jgi:hypothetical protein
MEFMVILYDDGGAYKNGATKEVVVNILTLSILHYFYSNLRQSTSSDTTTSTL